MLNAEIYIYKKIICFLLIPPEIDSGLSWMIPARSGKKDYKSSI